MSEEIKKMEVILDFKDLLKAKSAEESKNSGYRPGVVEWFLNSILQDAKSKEDIALERYNDADEWKSEKDNKKDLLKEYGNRLLICDSLDKEFSALRDGNKPTINFVVNLRVNREDFFKVGDELKEVCDELSKACNCDLINIEIYENLSEQSVSAPINYTYTINEINDIAQIYKRINDNIKKSNCNPVGLYFTDSETQEDLSSSRLSFEDVININQKIDDVVDIIKEKRFTPYETMLYIHNWLTSFEYKNKGSSSQMIIGPLNGSDIVCAGYVSLTKTIVDKLNMPGLECGFTSLKTILEDKSDYDKSHVICLIKIKDEKYNIDGIYHNDATWDCRRRNKREDMRNTGRFAHFMYPVTDRNHLIRDGRYINNIAYEPKSRRYQIICSTLEDEDACEITKEIRNRGISTKNERDELRKKKCKIFAERDAKQYEINRKEDDPRKILGSKELGEEVFKANVEPIKIETLIRGLFSVIKKDTSILNDLQEYKEIADIEEAVTYMICFSIRIAVDCFDSDSKNCLIQILKENKYYEAVDDEDQYNVLIETFKIIKQIVNDVPKEVMDEMSENDAYGRK